MSSKVTLMTEQKQEKGSESANNNSKGDGSQDNTKDNSEDDGSPDKTKKDASGSKDGDAKDEDAEESRKKNDPQVRRLKIIGRIVGVAIVAAAVLVVLLVRQIVTVNPRTEDASVGAHYIGMAPEVEGRVTALRVRDNGCVQKGQLLAELNSTQYQYSLTSALSNQATLEAQIAEEKRVIAADTNQAIASSDSLEQSRLGVHTATDSVKEADSELAAAQASLISANQRYQLAELTVKRNEELAADQYISREQFDEYKTSRDNALQTVEASKAQVAAAEARLRAAHTTHEESKINVSKSVATLRKDEYSIPLLSTLLAERPARQAEVNQAKLNLARTRIYAPFGGCVTALNISEGAVATPGSALFTLIDEDSWYVDAAFREGQLINIRPGMKADVFLMSDPHYSLAGVVQSISSGVMSSDSTTEGGIPGSPGSLPIISRSLNWVRLASRYAVRVKFRPRDTQRLRIGTSAEVFIRG